MAVSRRSSQHHGTLPSPPRSVLLASPPPETPSVTPDSAGLSPAESGAVAAATAAAAVEEVVVPKASPGRPAPTLCTAQGAGAAGEESCGAGGGFRELFEACRNGDVSRVKRLVNSVNVNAKDVTGRKSTPLHFAAGHRTHTAHLLALIVSVYTLSLALSILSQPPGSLNSIRPYLSDYFIILRSVRFYSLMLCYYCVRVSCDVI